MLVGSGLWIVTQYTLTFPESLPLRALGDFFVFLTLPVALFGFDPLPKWFSDRSSKGKYGELGPEENNELLFSNKRVMGLSLIVAGALWILFTVIGFWTAISNAPCPYYGCPSMLSYPGTWIMLAVGVALLASGIILLAMSISRRDTTRIKSRRNLLEMSTFYP